jgi:hypothetical protein
LPSSSTYRSPWRRAFCVKTLEDALDRHGKPDIFNTDQGSQFTGADFTGALASNGIATRSTAEVVLCSADRFGRNGNTNAIFTAVGDKLLLVLTSLRKRRA